MQQERAKLERRTEENKDIENSIKRTLLRDWILDFTIADDAFNCEGPVGLPSSESPDRVQAGSAIQSEVGKPHNGAKVGECERGSRSRRWQWRRSHRCPSTRSPRKREKKNVR